MIVTLSLIAVTAAVSALAWQDRRLLAALIYHGPTVSQGEYWRLVTHGLIHADGNHLLVNMITLFFFGSAMESVLTPRIGPAGFAGFYLTGIAAAALPGHIARRKDWGFRSLGASGAVTAMLFAFILLKPWAMLLVLVVPVPAVLFAVAYVVYSVRAERAGGDRINHSTHLWGAVWGVVFMIALEPGLAARFVERLLAPPWLG